MMIMIMMMKDLLLLPLQTPEPHDPISADVAACQQNFTVLMTDGLSDERDEPFDTYFPSANIAALSNADSDGFPTYNGAALDGGNSELARLADRNSDGDIVSGATTLADIAMYFYETDLRGAENLVPESVDINNSGETGDMHQHMVTFAVAFGVTGGLSCLPTEEGCSETWPNPSAISHDGTDLESLDDLGSCNRKWSWTIPFGKKTG